MATDSIVQEVREARDAYARKFKYDLEAICRDLQEQEKAGDHRVVSFPPRPVRPSQARSPRNR